MAPPRHLVWGATWSRAPAAATRARNYRRRIVRLHRAPSIFVGRYKCSCSISAPERLAVPRRLRFGVRFTCAREGSCVCWGVGAGCLSRARCPRARGSCRGHTGRREGREGRVTGRSGAHFSHRWEKLSRLRPLQGGGERGGPSEGAPMHGRWQSRSCVRGGALSFSSLVAVPSC